MRSPSSVPIESSSPFPVPSVPGANGTGPSLPPSHSHDGAAGARSFVREVALLSTTD